MAISLTTLTGPVYMPSGATPFGGKVTFELTSWDREPGEAVFVSGPYHADIDENGHFEVELFTTTEGSNSVNYKMYVHWFDSNGAGDYTNQAFNSHGTNNYIKEYIGSFALSGEGPYKISDINIVSELATNSFDVLMECSSFVDMAKIEAIKSAFSANTVQNFIDTYSEVSDFNAAVDVILSPEKDRILELEEVIASNPQFDTIALMAAYGSATDGDYATISATGERFQYIAASTLTADGVLIVDAVGMGENPATRGRLVSTRMEYASYTEAKVDRRVFDDGDVLTIRGVTGTLTARATLGTWGEANTGGQNFDAHSLIGDVRLWGCNGDGKTDNAAAIERIAANHRVMYFPIPDDFYYVSRTVALVPIHLVIKGADQYETTIKGPVDSNFPILQIGAATTTWGAYGNVTIQDINIDGNRSAGANSTASKGIEFLSTTNIEMLRVRVANTRGYGVEFYWGGYNSIRDCNFTRHGITGLYLNGSDASDSVTSTLVEKCVINTCGTYGIHAKDFFNITLTENIIESIGTGGVGAAVKLEGAALRNFVMKHNYLEANNNAAHDVDFYNVGIQGLCIQDNWMAGTPATSTYNGGGGGGAVVNGIIQDNEGGDAVTSLADVVGVRSIELLGRKKTQTSSEVVVTTTGGVDADAATITIDGAGVWAISADVQIVDAGSGALTSAGIYIAGASGQTGLQTATNVNFKEGADCVLAALSPTQRLRADLLFTGTGTPQKLWLATYVNISGGAVAYKANLKAVRVG